jgi:protein TonB
LLIVVIALHATIFLLVLAAKTVIPQLVEMPLVVDLLLAPAPSEPQAKPLPMIKSPPVIRHRAPPPEAPRPQIEATQSTEPTESSPSATPHEIKAAPAPTPPANVPVLQARFDADYLKNPVPPYPPRSRRLGEEGQVVLRVSVNPQGTTDSVEIRTSSGSQRLDEAALSTVRNWKFIPAKRGDTPLQSWVLVPITFKLEQ